MYAIHIQICVRANNSKSNVNANFLWIRTEVIHRFSTGLVLFLSA